MEKGSIREFETLRAMIISGTTTGASRRLGISQPAVSRALAQLEGRLGVILFTREGGRLVPTAEALMLNEELQPLFDALDKLKTLRLIPRKSDHLKVAAPASFCLGYLQKLLMSFRETQPTLSFELVTADSEAIIAMVAEGMVDTGISDMRALHSGVEFETLFSASAVCVMPPDHPLTQKPQITPEDLIDVPFIALSKRHATRSKIDGIFDKAGVERLMVAETSTAAAACAFVAAGLGVAVMNPFPVDRLFSNKIELRPFTPTVDYDISLITPANRPLSSITRRFRSHLKFVLRSGPRDYSRPSAPNGASNGGLNGA